MSVLWGLEEASALPAQQQDLARAIASGVSAAIRGVLGDYDALFVAWWVANGPCLQSPTTLANPLPIIAGTQGAQQAARANELRRGATVQNVGSATIVVGKTPNVGRPGQSDAGLQVIAGTSLILSGGEWIEEIWWGTINGAVSASQATIHEELVPAPPWPRP